MDAKVDVLSLNLNMRLSLNKSFYRSDELCKHVEHGSNNSKITGLTMEHSQNTLNTGHKNISHCKDAKYS